jgi:AraC-like DNA-binding protein
MYARFPFEVARVEQSGTFMLACTGGRGVVLADGRWTNVKAGEACLLPPFIHNALKCVPGEPWEFAWVRYKESREKAPVISAHSPVSGKLNGMLLKAGILGLHAEASGDSTPSAIHHWTELIHHYVIRFAQPHSSDQRLWKVWKHAGADLARQWTLAELAAVACMSPEHLRRTCSREIGRSPMRHLTYLRLKHAADVLSTTDIKVEIVARAVGFENPFAFSNTFKKWFGWRPSDHRNQKRRNDAE